MQYIEGDFTVFETVEGKVYPERTDVPVTYEKDANIKIMNYSGKSVTVSAKSLEGSEVKTDIPTIISFETGELAISAGNDIVKERLTLLSTNEWHKKVPDKKNVLSSDCHFGGRGAMRKGAWTPQKHSGKQG